MMKLISENSTLLLFDGVETFAGKTDFGMLFQIMNELKELFLEIL